MINIDSALFYAIMTMMRAGETEKGIMSLW